MLMPRDMEIIKRNSDDVGKDYTVREAILLE